MTQNGVNVEKRLLFENRLGGDDISGRGAVPQSGANPGIRKRPLISRPDMGATAVGNAE
jgi:hypothetical protein